MSSDALVAVCGSPGGQGSALGGQWWEKGAVRGGPASAWHSGGVLWKTPASSRRMGRGPGMAAAAPGRAGFGGTSSPWWWLGAAGRRDSSIGVAVVAMLGWRRNFLDHAWRHVISTSVGNCRHWQRPAGPVTWLLLPGPCKRPSPGRASSSLHRPLTARWSPGSGASA